MGDPEWPVERRRYEREHHGPDDGQENGREDDGMDDGPIGGKIDTSEGDRHMRRAERSLADALQLVRDRRADRNDTVTETREAERARIDLLVDELRPLFEEIDPDDERFELAVSGGQKPRLWIDATTHVSMGTDRRTYRLIRDRLHERSVLAETGDLDLMADTVSTYIAERVLERRRAQEGDWMRVVERSDDIDPAHSIHAARRPEQRYVEHHEPPAEHVEPRREPVRVDTHEARPSKRGWWKAFLLGALQFMAGLALVALVLAALVWFAPDAFS